MDHDVILQRLRRELELVQGHVAKRTTIPAAQIPWWRMILAGRKVRKISKSAKRVDRALNALVPKPMSPEDHELISKGRTADEILADIKRVPVVRARCIEVGTPEFSGIEVRQFWFRHAERYEGRETPGFCIADAAPRSLKASKFPYSLADSGGNSLESDPINIHRDERDRTSVTTHRRGLTVKLSKATHAIFLRRFKRMTFENTGEYDAYMIFPRPLQVSSGTLPIWVALAFKKSGAITWFEVIESR